MPEKGLGVKPSVSFQEEPSHVLKGNIITGESQPSGILKKGILKGAPKLKLKISRRPQHENIETTTLL